MVLDKKVRESLAKTFKVPGERCDTYNQFYNEV
jgi:hypothetical protein